MASIRSFTQQVYDVIRDSQRMQRDIGTVAHDKSTLTIKGTLTKVNTVDFFKFKVSGKMTDLGIVIKAAGTPVRPGAAANTVSSVDVKNDVGFARVQLLDKRGNVIADSSATATVEQQKAYQKLRTSKLDLKADTYTLKVTRSPGVLTSKKVPYAIQLVSGTPKNAYTTTELDAQGADTNYTPVRGAMAVDIIDASTTSDTPWYTAPATGTIFDFLS
ncbi:MAG: hypothetical protein PHX43_06455 [Alphaproteobacteria bacterium]|nr:hypothetical protein [Alphaproteobacteria bacterium]